MEKPKNQKKEEAAEKLEKKKRQLKNGKIIEK